MQKEFLGFHSEWNMGSPGGWDYQRMAQEIATFSWKRIKDASGIKIDLDFQNPILNPVPRFAQLLLRAHKKNFGRTPPSIALVAEKETLDKVGENIRFVKYLNSLPGVKASLIDPAKLEERNGEIYAEGNKVTLIFLDFNNNVIVKLRKKYNLEPLLTAIKKGMVVNPRGMEPMGAKGIFEAITSDYKNLLTKSTVKRTPWTRKFYPRSTKGANGEDIPDLIKWVEENWQDIILKPIHGYSGKGIIVGHKEANIDSSIQQALDKGDYVVQKFIPTEIWAEEFPWVDKENKKLFLKQWQTDFRCFITDKGIIGFVTRFGGIPTNVGSGGGVQSTAILRSNLPIKEAIKIINETILDLGYDFIQELQDEIDKQSIEIGNVYLLGPLSSTLRPRILTEGHIKEIAHYGKNLWRDALKLEGLWLNGSLEKFVHITEEEEAIARMDPWRGKTGLIASDGLFGFGGGL